MSDAARAINSWAATNNATHKFAGMYCHLESDIFET